MVNRMVGIESGVARVNVSVAKIEQVTDIPATHKSLPVWALKLNVVKAILIYQILNHIAFALNEM